MKNTILKIALSCLIATGCSIKSQAQFVHTAASGGYTYCTPATDKVSIGYGSATVPTYKLEVRDSLGTCWIRAKSLSSYAGLIIDKGATAQNGYILHRSAGATFWSEGTKGNNNFSLYNWSAGSEAMTINVANNFVGLGTLTPAYRLDVCGTIRAKELRVETGWCDYVFASDYKLPSLSDVESFIKANRHLPEVTPGPTIESDGLEVGKASSQMIRKIEELTLYIIEQDKAINNLKAQVNSLVEKGGK